MGRAHLFGAHTRRMFEDPVQKAWDFTRVLRSRCRFLGFDEHKVHDRDDGDPEEQLFVPKQHFSILKEAQRQADGNGHGAIAEGGRFNGGVGPYRKAAEVDKKRHDIDFEAAADG